MIVFDGNCATTVVRQGKYRLVHHGDSLAVEVVIETPDGMRLYPASRGHPDLAAMVNGVKTKLGAAEGGQFYINEYRQVIVPAGNPVNYFFAGEYPADLILKLDDQEFSGRPHDDHGNLLKPGDPWSGRPRPGIKYTLKAGGADVEYAREISPGREKIVRLSKIVSLEPARQTARKIAAVRGNRGGPFYVNEYRAIFGPVKRDDNWNFVFIGTLTEQDPWFPKWQPGKPAAPTAPTQPVSVVTPFPGAARERTVEIADGAQGYSYDALFADYLRHATSITVEDPFVSRPHQVANFLRLCELAVRLGAVRSITLVTGVLPDDAYAKLQSIKRSLQAVQVELESRSDTSLHDRSIRTDTGWIIHLGRGLDIYKKPEDFCAVGATDFALRPCYKTTLIYQREQAKQRAGVSTA
jgi:hypothetical protein